ncbi:M15 family metallopeptidase [Thermodesulfobacteriota bacterium]
MHRLLICVLVLNVSVIHLFPTAVLSRSIEKIFITAGLVDMATINRTVKVNLVNSDPQKNFFREDFYKGLNKAYLRKPVALKLSRAQQILKAAHPSYSLQILDAARPRSVSRAMYEKVQGTKFERYVAHPDKGSMHNFGVAVDITIVDPADNEIDMGLSPFNKTKLEIYWQYVMTKLGRQPSKKQKENRKLLSDVMQEAGFYPLSFEWWHFNGLEKEETRNKYDIIE